MRFFESFCFLVVYCFVLCFVLCLWGVCMCEFNACLEILELELVKVYYLLIGVSSTNVVFTLGLFSSSDKLIVSSFPTPLCYRSSMSEPLVSQPGFGVWPRKFYFRLIVNWVVSSGEWIFLW